MKSYDLLFVDFVDVDDVADGGDHIDVDGSEWVNVYPSSDTVFWNDISTILYHKTQHGLY